VLLEALGRAADRDGNGAISMTELADYLDREVPALTGGAQRLGVEMRFLGDILAAGL